MQVERKCAVINKLYFEVDSSGSTVVKHSTHNPKIKGSNHTTSAGTDKMANNV
jgi:hypothetical protein